MADNIAVVVLGMRIGEKGISDELKGRVDKGIEELLESGAGLLILTGGHTNPDILDSEAGAMLRYIQSAYHDISAKIVLEEEAMDTIGNAVFTEEKLEDHPSINDIRVITSCYHSDRSLYIFNEVLSSKYSNSAPRCFNTERDQTAIEKAKLDLARVFLEQVKSSKASIKDALLLTDFYKK